MCTGPPTSIGDSLHSWSMYSCKLHYRSSIIGLDQTVRVIIYVHRPQYHFKRFKNVKGGRMITNLFREKEFLFSFHIFSEGYRAHVMSFFVHFLLVRQHAVPSPHTQSVATVGSPLRSFPLRVTIQVTIVLSGPTLRDTRRRKKVDTGRATINCCWLSILSGEAARSKTKCRL